MTAPIDDYPIREKPDKPFPDSEAVFPGFAREGDVALSCGGLTKRELFAAMAMQGLLGGVEYGSLIDCDSIAIDALACADSLLAKLRGSSTDST